MKAENNKNEKPSLWELQNRIEKILDANIKEIPYEGKEVNFGAIQSQFLELIFEIAPEYKPKDTTDNLPDYWCPFDN